MLKDLLSLFFPSICPGCENALLGGEKIICTYCLSSLPIRRTSGYVDQGMEDDLVGRIPVEYCFSFLQFYKGSSVQHLLHALKYNNHPEIGRKLGAIFGRELQALGHVKPIDMIVPVPLHPSRLRRRGYNQSEEFAVGLEEGSKISCVNDLLIRFKVSETQTFKSRAERMKNVQGIFRVNGDAHINRHVLIVDDVFTTGATIEACANTLITSARCKISVATIAHAEF